MAEIIISDKQQRDSMSEYYACAFRLSKEEREVKQPKVGQKGVYMNSGTESRRILMPVRLKAIQEELDGGCICICVRYIS